MEELVHQGTYSRFLQHIDINQVNTICELGSRYGLDTVQLAKYFDAAVVGWQFNTPSI